MRWWRGLYAVINQHWDNGWLQPTYEAKDEATRRFNIMWKQIAVYFRDYPDYLLFAGTNEVVRENDWGTPTEEYYTVQNGYNQVFVNTVRATGGRDTYRYLLVQGFATNIDNANFMVMPTDPVPNRLLVEVYYYDSYDFTINLGNMTITQWGKDATDTAKTEAWADGQFQKMKVKFADNGIGVYIGEYGVIARINLGSDAANLEYMGFRNYYVEYITQSIVNHGLVPVYWDNGSLGDKGMAIFDRKTGRVKYPDILAAIMKSRPEVGIKCTPDCSTRRSPNGGTGGIRQSGTTVFYANPDVREALATFYTIDGSLLKTTLLQPGVSALDIGTLVPGCYLFKVAGRSGTVSARIIRE